jgi:enoyl-CoA hydratase
VTARRMPVPAFTTILYETLAPVARITLNRPERTNAISATMLDELARAMDAAEADPDVRA